MALHDGDFENDEIGIIPILVAAGLVKSNGEARRAIQQNGVAINDTKVTDPFMKISKAALLGGSMIVSRGKKNFRKIIVE
jgi:tyrosyl-tRNA synthetase